MNLDYILVGGLVLGEFSIPAMLAAWADGRPFLPAWEFWCWAS